MGLIVPKCGEGQFEYMGINTTKEGDWNFYAGVETLSNCPERPEFEGNYFKLNI